MSEMDKINKTDWWECLDCDGTFNKNEFSTDSNGNIIYECPECCSDNCKNRELRIDL
jgi:hypothetical protein